MGKPKRHLTEPQPRNWVALFQGTKHPAYVTLVQPPITGITPTKKKRVVSQILMDDVMDASAADQETNGWAPSTFEIKNGSFVLAAPDDADSADKTTTQQPWLIRVNKMWFIGGEGTLKPDTKQKDDADLYEWERRQLRKGRLHSMHFQVEMNYFYRLSDLRESSALYLAGDKDTDTPEAKRNSKTLCAALVTLGVVDSTEAAQKLIDNPAGSSTARRLLSRFICFSTHEGKLAADNPQSDDDESDEEEEELLAPDGTVPLESVMAPFKVMFLSAKQGLPFMQAPVPEAAVLGDDPAGLRSLKAERLNALLASQRQGYMELPPGFFCSLIYIKQANQLLSLEEWAAGRAGHNLKGSWVQSSREQAKELLKQSRKQLEELQAAMKRRLRQQQQQQQQQELQQEPDSNAAAAAAAAAGGGGGGVHGLESDDLLGDQVGVGSDGDAAAAGFSDSDEDDGLEQQQRQEEHSIQARTPERQQQRQRQQQLPAQQAHGVQPQRRTPRKSKQPRRALEQQQEEPQAKRRRLRSTAQAAGGGDGGHGSSSSGSGSEGDSDEGGSSEEEEEEDSAGAGAAVVGSHRKRGRAGAGAAAAAGGGGAAGHARARARHPAKPVVVVSSDDADEVVEVEDDSGDEQAAAAAAAAAAYGSDDACSSEDDDCDFQPESKPRKAAAAAGGSKRGAGAAAAAGGGGGDGGSKQRKKAAGSKQPPPQQQARKTLRSSKANVLRHGKVK